MYSIQISDEDNKKIGKLRNSHPNQQVRKRLSILYFKSLCLPHRAIRITVGCSSQLITSVLKMYKEDGLNKVLEIQRYVRVSELLSYKDLILQAFQDSPPSSAKHASDVIYQLTGLKRGLTQTKAFLHKIGLKPRKTAVIPAKADPEVQEEFKKNSRTNSSRSKIREEASIFCGWSTSSS